MALDTLIGLKEINGFKIAVMDDLKKTNPELFPNDSMQMDYKVFEEEFRPKYPIQIRHDKNSISFTLQNGPVKEVGVNGCQVLELICAAREIISRLNDKYPCEENQKTVDALADAIHWQNERTKDREDRNVEGLNKN